MEDIVLAVVGSREFNNYALLEATLANVKGEIVEIVSGGARGADTLAEKYARKHDIPLKVYPAQWDVYGKKAGYLRNQQIIARASHVIAFWNGESRGTKHSIKLAKHHRKPVYIKRI